MTPKAVIENRDYHLLETVPLLSGQEKFVLCEDGDGNRFVCPEDFWLRHAPAPEAAAPIHAGSTSQEKIVFFLSLFRGREGLYAKRYHNLKSGKSGYVPACQNEWVPGICDKKAYRCPECPNRAFKPLTAQTVRAHLMGNDEFCRDVAGIYPMLESDCTWLLAVDFDEEFVTYKEQWAFLSTLHRISPEELEGHLRSCAAAGNWERCWSRRSKSRGRKSGHRKN